jgi:hypothetical protein
MTNDLVASARMCGDPLPGYPWVPIIITAVLVVGFVVAYWWIILRKR